MQQSTTLRNNKLSQLAVTIGTAPKLRFYAGTVPATTADAPGGTLLAELTLPSTWVAAPSGGSAAQSGVWETAAALASGTPTYFRIYDTTGTNCHLQGTVPGDMTGSPGTVTLGSPVAVVGYSFVEGGA